MKQFVNKCIECRKLRGKKIDQPQGPLHEQQRTYFQPFENITMDCFGPLELSNGSKGNGSVVVCRVSKAFKILVLEDMTTNTLESTLLNLWGMVGYPKYIWSDNGTNFIGFK